MSTTAASSGIGIPGWMFLIFMTLKLCGVITWSWWWVTAPLWIPFAAFVGIALVVLIIIGIGAFAGFGPLK